MTRQTILMASLALLLAACGGPVTNPDSAAFVLPLGTRFVINEPITVPPNTGHVTFQYGKPVAEGNLKGADDFYPHCRIEIDDVAPEPRTIAPGTWTLVRVQDFNELYSAPDQVLFRTYYTLRGDGQRKLTVVCAQRNDAWEFDYVTLPQMREALGKYVTIRLPDEKG
ncbi:MAG TPA: hypothetical protein ENI93_03180 [Gammaproteobacteria bacterium]|nr:hypothetical protein [Gammaproteobacteria bacterium]